MTQFKLLPTNGYSKQLLFVSVLLAILIVGYVKVYGSDPQIERALERVVEAWDVINRSPNASEVEAPLTVAAVRGMLSTLDPHTHFLDEETYRYMKQEQEGGFYGIGISFDIRDGVLTVISPIEDTPAWKAGIRAGDQIVKIEGKPTVGITSTEVINTLRGKYGSKVVISVQRQGVEEIWDVELVRDKIPLKSVRNPLLLDAHTGYVRLNNFAQTTDQELRLAMLNLRSEGASRLILDLRFNSGGLLSAAQDVAELFLAEDQTIVMTRGRLPGSNMDLKVEELHGDVKTPLIVLVNEYSASASEIVAGAIQDHDRGIIIGETTFGKGLVGSLYPLSGDTALQITTAQYYTASGRYIQKPYDIPHRKVLMEEEKPIFKGAKKEGEKLVYYTANGRKVYGGGGIIPDIVVEEPKIQENLRQLENSFFDFAVTYLNQDNTFTVDSEVTDALLAQLKSYLAAHNVALDPGVFEAELETIKRDLKQQLLSVAVNADEAYRYSLYHHPMIIKALEVFPEINQVISQQISTDRQNS